jgi:acetyl esterase/lipase
MPRVPVWLWRVFMAGLEPFERRRFALGPVYDVESELDIDYRGLGRADQRLDVIRPAERVDASLPVYVYFHGGGWTSGSKSALTNYCAAQAETGMVVVNVEYRKAPRARMVDMLDDGAAALEWVQQHIGEHGGDPTRIVLGGDSAGGQLASLLAQLAGRPELARYWGVRPPTPTDSIRGIVQHCAALDFSVVFRRGFIMGHGFVRMLLPAPTGRDGLVARARWLSPIEWLWPEHPPVLVTTSRRDMFFDASRNFAAAARALGVRVVEHIDDSAQHTWQQDVRHPASAPVYTKLAEFVRSVTEIAAPGTTGPIRSSAIA